MRLQNLIESLEARHHLSAEVPYSPHVVTGTRGVEISAWQYDKGGEGVAYHDATPGNQGNLRLRSDGVDLYSSSAFKDYWVGSTSPGDWLRYTLDVRTAGRYQLALGPESPEVWQADTTATGGPAAGEGAILHASVDGRVWGQQLILDRWDPMPLPGTDLAVGRHVVQITFDKAGRDGTGGNWSFLRVVPVVPLAIPDDFRTTGPSTSPTVDTAATPPLLSTTNAAGSVNSPDALVFDQQNRLLMGTWTGSSPADDEIVIARLRSNGSRDLSFGPNGQRHYVLPQTIPASTGSSRALAIGVDDTLTVARTYQATAGKFVIELVRYNPVGRLDSKFGHGGIARYAYAMDSNSLDLQVLRVTDDSRIVLAAFMNTHHAGQGVVWEFGATGFPNRTFSDGYSSQPDLIPTTALVQNDGSVVLVGTSVDYLYTTVIRIDPKGHLDTRFKPTSLPGQPTTQIVRRTDGDLIIGLRTVAGVDPSVTADSRVVALLSTGGLDKSFGYNGFAAMPFAGSETSVNDVVAGLNGQIYVGWSRVPFGSGGEEECMIEFSSAGQPTSLTRRLDQSNFKTIRVGRDGRLATAALRRGYSGWITVLTEWTRA